MISDGLESVFAGGVGDSFSLAIRVDIGVRAFSVTLGVGFFFEFDAVLLRVRRAELTGGVQVSGFADDGGFLGGFLLS